MTQYSRSGLARYAVAVLSVALAVLIRLALNPVWGDHLPFITFHAAIIVSAWYGGIKPGLLAVLLSACSAAYLWLPPHYSLRVTRPADWVGLAMFMGVSLMIVGILEAMHRARRQAEASARALIEREAQYRRIAETANEGIWEVDAEWRTTYANERMAEMLGLSVKELIGRAAMDFLVDEEPLMAKQSGERSQQGFSEIQEWRLRRVDGSEIWIQSNATPILSPAGEFQGAFALVTDISERERAESERERAESERERAESERERAESRLRLLSAASETLTASLDLEVVLQSLARLCVPGLADQCIVDILNEDGVPELVAIARLDQEREERLRELRRRYPPNPAKPSPLWEAIRGNKPILIREFDEAITQAVVENEEHLALARAMLARSAVITPLAVNGKVLGALSLSITDSERRFDEGDLALAIELARRAAVAVNNAMLYRATERAEAAAQRHATRLQVLDETARAISAAGLSLDEVLRTVTRRAAELIGGLCSLRLVAEDGQYFEPPILHHPDPVAHAMIREYAGGRRDPVNENFYGRVMTTGEALLLPEVTPDDWRAMVAPQHQTLRQRLPIHSIVAVPLHAHGRILGVLGMSRTTAGQPFALEDQTLLLQLADRAALAIEKAQLYQATATAEAQAARHAVRMQALAEVSRLLADAELDLPRVLDTTARQVVAHLGDSCTVRLLSPDGQWLEMAAFDHRDAAAKALIGAMPEMRRIPVNEAIFARVLASGQPWFAPDAEQETLDETFPAAIPYRRRYPAQSFIIAPLRARGRTIGMIATTREQGTQRLTSEDCDFLQALAYRAALAIENARLYQAVVEAEARAERHAARLQILDENARALSQAGLDADAIMEAATRRVAELIGDLCSLRFLEEDGDFFGPAVIYHTDPVIAEDLRAIDRTTRVRLSESLSAYVFETGESLLIPDITAEEALEKLHPQYRDYVRRHPIYSVLIAPVRMRGRVAGALSLTRSKPGNPYTEDDRRLLEELADRTALAVENARLYAKTTESEAQAQQQAARMVALAEVSKALTEAGFDQQALFETITRQVADVMGDNCVLRLLSEDRQVLPVKAFWSSNAELQAHMAKVFAAETLEILPCYTSVLTSGQAVFLNQGELQELHTTLPTGYRSLSEGHNATAGIIVALRSGGVIVGALACGRAGRTYTKEEQLLFQELADRASLALEKARLFAEVQEASRRKDEFLAMLGHELRNPISAMLNAHLAAAVTHDETTKARTQEILDRQLKHLSRLVDDLLDVSRITQGKISLQCAPVDLARLVRDTCEDLRIQAERSGLTLDLDCGKEEPPLWVNGDGTRLAQMLTNLVMNAVKFTDAGGRITVGLRIEEKPSDLGRQDGGAEEKSAIVEVRDTGIGIEAQMLPRVFDTFAQADRSLGRSRGGLGLGLALVKGLAELHGGKVTAQSDGMGHGSAFTFRLPLIAAPLEAVTPTDAKLDGKFPASQDRLPDLPPQAIVPPISVLSDGLPATAATMEVAAVVPAAAPAATPGPFRVLVIDDNQDSADMACLMLQFYGHETEAVYSGHKGLTAVERLQPDAVCCDIGLPEIDGYEVARELRRRGFAGLLIAVSGYGQEEDKRRSREAGFDAHIVKPVDPELLDKVLRKTVRDATGIIQAG